MPASPSGRSAGPVPSGVPPRRRWYALWWEQIQDRYTTTQDPDELVEMIEAAAARGGTFADTEVALKKLAARASQLPLALESARAHADAMIELENSSPELLADGEIVDSESNRESRPERMN